MADLSQTLYMLAACWSLLLTVRAQGEANIPVISGPTAVVSDVSKSWRCMVDGASSSAPNVYWQFGNGTRLPSDTFSNTYNDYRDANNSVNIQVSSVLTLRLSGPGAVQLVCVVVHYETQTQNTAYTTVTVHTSPDEKNMAASTTVINDVNNVDNTVMSSIVATDSSGPTDETTIAVSTTAVNDVDYTVMSSTDSSGPTNGTTITASTTVVNDVDYTVMSSIATTDSSRPTNAAIAKHTASVSTVSVVMLFLTHICSH